MEQIIEEYGISIAIIIVGSAVVLGLNLILHSL